MRRRSRSRALPFYHKLLTFPTIWFVTMRGKRYEFQFISGGKYLSIETCLTLIYNVFTVFFVEKRSKTFLTKKALEIYHPLKVHESCANEKNQ